MGFIGSNKRFLWAAVGAPGSTHDSRLLKSCDLFAEIQQGHVFTNTGSSIADFPLPDFALSVNLLHCSFNHLYFARSLTTDVSIAFSFPFLEQDMFSVCKRASNSFLIASKI